MMNRTGKRHKLFGQTCCSAELPQALNFFDTRHSLLSFGKATCMICEAVETRNSKFTFVAAYVVLIISWYKR